MLSLYSYKYCHFFHKVNNYRQPHKLMKHPCKHLNKIYNKCLCLSVIHQKPLGQQLLPMAYVKQKMRKPDHLTWDQFLAILNREFKSQQDTKIANMTSALRQKKAWDKANAIIAEQNAQKERDRLQKIADEQKKKDDEEKERKLKEEQERVEREKKREEEKKQREKEEREQKEKQERAQQEAEQMAKKLIPSFFDNDNEEVPVEDLNLSALSAGRGSGIDFDSIVNLQERTVDVNQRNFDIATTLGKNLKEVSSALLDPDVMYALKHLKEIGIELRQYHEKEDSSSAKPVQRMLDLSHPVNQPNSAGPTQMLSPLHIKTEKDDAVPINTPSFPVRSPPQKLFIGMKRCTSDTFTDAVSTKKRRGGGTPGRGRVTSPAHTPVRHTRNIDECIAQADAKSRNAEIGNKFLRSKKVTPANGSIVFHAVLDKNREIIEFPFTPLSFYRILAHYSPDMAFVPEDERPFKLKTKLLNFVMQNIEHTKVTNVTITQLRHNNIQNKIKSAST